MAAVPPADRIALYEALVATQPEVQRRGATVPYTAVNGNMFSYLNSDGILALRLPATARDEFITRFGAALAVAHGIVQREYVAVPHSLLEFTAELAPYFTASHEYARSLRPKATKKPKQN